ncbi:PEP-CTERM sorting domain-containing protein [Duganella sp. HH105]|uniref:PEP-CTERM sorting domain-containing protein n=1 Tax=Duganella sp. HH105 TaxID=1781067 RepID=UPI000877D567|nr:PEP-CTERM sorting domain-containing protein [Duganella sp. HH105]OEZ61541.1 PEP-CTERM motif protein [Duganella sp. HH105]
MLKKTLAIAALISTCLTAQAAPQTYNFSYTGAFNDWFQTWNPDYSLTGSFKGEDTNLDGVISKNELSWLIVDGYNYLHCWENCAVNYFSYDLKKSLSFYVYSRYVYDGTWYSTTSKSSDGTYHDMEHWPWSVNDIHTNNTVFAISVPEPSTYAMMGAGLLGLALVQRRRKKSA